MNYVRLEVARPLNYMNLLQVHENEVAVLLRSTVGNLCIPAFIKPLAVE